MNRLLPLLMVLVSALCGCSSDGAPGCKSDSDCEPGFRCAEGECLEVSDCTGDADCNGMRCDTGTGECVECLGDENCDSDQICREGGCVDVTTCESDVDCAEPEPACDLASGICVACVGNDHCEAGMICVENACIVCPADIPGADSDGDGVADDQDCMPCDPRVHPEVIAFLSDPLPDGSWDYNCDGIEEKQYPSEGRCTGAPNCSPQQGFYRVPECGGLGELIDYCISHQYSCGVQWERSNSSVQRCR